MKQHRAPTPICVCEVMADVDLHALDNLLEPYHSEGTNAFFNHVLTIPYARGSAV